MRYCCVGLSKRYYWVSTAVHLGRRCVCLFISSPTAVYLIFGSVRSGGQLPVRKGSEEHEILRLTNKVKAFPKLIVKVVEQ